METPLFTFLISWAAFNTVKRENKTGAFTGLIYGIAALVRPEGLLFILLALVYVLHRSRSIKEVAKFAAPAVIVLLPFQVWRISYYGELLPNTFYAKTTVGFELVAAGFDYLARGFSSFSLWIFLIPTLASFIEPKSRRYSAFFLWLALPYCAYVIYVGGDWMPMFRFIIPVLPMYYVMVALGMADLLPVGTTVPHKRYVYFFWIALITIAGWLTFEYSATKRDELITRYNNLLGVKKVGLWLAENASPDSTIALGFVGTIPYYSRLDTVDIWGITNKDIAHQPFRQKDILGPGHYKHNADSVLAKEPDIIIFNGCLGDVPDKRSEPQGPAKRDIFNHPAFAARYRHESVPLGKGCYFRFYISKERAYTVLN